MMRSMDAGNRIGDRYRVLARLGDSQALTLLCSDEHADDREVVLKLLDVGDAETWRHVDLFRSETSTLASLDHPAIPAILDSFDTVDSDGDPVLVLVTEKVEGTSLAHRIDRGPRLGIDDVMVVVREMLDVLEYLHTRVPRVVHRDLKPSNIIVRPDGSPALIDFGGVRAVWRAPSRETMTIVGTAGYMPPEQFLGQVTPRCDLYALGATLLHLMTGLPPTEHDYDTGRLEVPEDLPGPPGLHRLMAALLQPAPRDRPVSASAARAILDDPAPVEEPVTTLPAVVVEAEPPVLVHSEARVVDSEARVVDSEASEEARPIRVDAGIGPRDVDGRLRDVYANLVPYPLALHRMGKGSPAVGFGELLGNVLFLMPLSLGLLPLILAYTWWGRWREYKPLFVDGTWTPDGKVTHVDEHAAGPWAARVEYEFVDGRGETFTGGVNYGHYVVMHWTAGDAIDVLYDPDDPTRNVAIYR